MKIITCLVFCSVMITQCNTQTFNKIVVVNNSSYNIDSILISYYLPNTYTEKILPGKSKVFNIDISNLNTHLEGFQSIFFYYNHSKWEAEWGVHTLGSMEKYEDSFFIFNHGCNALNQALEKPKQLRIQIANYSSQKLDSVEVPDVQIFEKRESINYVGITLNYTQFRESPVLKITQNKKLYSIKIDHNWDNYNETVNYFNLGDNGKSLTHEEVRMIEERLRRQKNDK